MRTEDIVNRIFTRSFMGYDIEEVDRFLDEVIDVIEQYEAEKKEMMTAMEFLMQKIENDERPPAAEMRRAIDSGKPAKKRTALPERTQDVRIPVKRADKGAPDDRKEKQDGAKAKTARAITTGGSKTPKPVRAPKVKRVSVPQPEAAGEQPAQAQKNEDWLDELLDNLSERDKRGYPPEPAQPVEQDENAVTAAQPPKQPATAQPAPETKKAQIVPEPPRAQAAPQRTEPPKQAEQTQSTPEPPKATATEPRKSPPTIQPTDGTREPMEQGPKQETPSTEDAIRSFEETLRSLGGQIKPEAAAQTDERRPEGNEEHEAGTHVPKHAAATEDERQ